MSNDDFASVLQSHGLRPRKMIAPDGKWHRCPTESHPHKKNGAYKFALDGRIGWFRDFAIDQESHTWRPDATTEAPAYDPSWLKRAQAETREKQTAASDEARAFYDSCKQIVAGHCYLESHGLDMTGAHGLRIDKDGWLVVPAHRGRHLVTVQRISATGQKLFWSGAPVKGASYAIGKASATTTVLCEGLATGLAIYAAMPDARVIVAFNAGNLKQIRPPAGFTVIAADNDWATACQRHRDEGRTFAFDPWEERPDWCKCNPGRVAAEEAASVIGCGVAVPDGIEGTDWADWRDELYTARLEMRKPKERETDIRRAVDAQLAMHIRRQSRFIKEVRP